jgi:hypothetical protein
VKALSSYKNRSADANGKRIRERSLCAIADSSREGRKRSEADVGGSCRGGKCNNVAIEHKMITIY